MARYESYTKELLLRKYRDDGLFSHDEIINNDLSDTSFQGIRLNDVFFKESFLDRTLLNNMKCKNVVIEQSNCTSIQAMDSQIDRCHMVNSNFIKADFSHSTIDGVVFKNCVAHSIHFSHARITSSYFTECQMYKSRFDCSILIKVIFEPGAQGDLSTLQKANFSSAMIIESSFSCVNLIGAIFNDTIFIGCNFIGAHLDEIDRSKASFIHCIFDDNISISGKVKYSPTGKILF